MNSSHFLVYQLLFLNAATTVDPPYKLLRNSESWQWNKQQVAFEKIKETLTAPNLLVHFDESKPLMLLCDASSYGVGAVLSHVYADQLDKPIAYPEYSRAKILTVRQGGVGNIVWGM